MTREETYKRFKRWAQDNIGNHGSDEDYNMAENIMALLSQEPCEDAISREYIQEKYATCADMLHPDADIVMARVDEAPPVRVTKKEKTGKWKKVMDKSWDYVWQCDCGCRQGMVTNYCPDCGTKMER